MATTKHTGEITLDGKVFNNNKKERMNGEIRDREKTMRGLKRKHSNNFRLLLLKNVPKSYS